MIKADTMNYINYERLLFSLTVGINDKLYNGLIVGEERYGCYYLKH